MTNAPHHDVDFYSDEFIANPLPHYAGMRALGPVVYLPRHDNYAVVHYLPLREAMRNADIFRSGEGVAGDAVGCSFLRGNTLASDFQLHDEMRGVMSVPLLPGALEAHRALIQQVAEALVQKLCEGGQFDGMEVARHLPLAVVTELVGLPKEGRESMLTWAASAFDILGVQNERGRAGVERMKEMRQWIATRATPERLKPGSWTARIMELSASGEIPEAMAHLLIRDYINPSLDTTISATGELLYQLGQCPDQWDLIRANPQLIPRAVEEAVRLASPVRSFTRRVSRDFRLAGVDLPAGARVMMVFASANRDEAHFENPDQFDVMRAQCDHVGFGHGAHTCAGMHLARLEMSALLKALAPRVQRFHVGHPTIAMNNTIRSYERFSVRIDVAADYETQAPKPVLDAGKDDHWIEVRIVTRTTLAETVVGLTFEPTGIEALPRFSAGSHVDLEVRPGVTRQYSLCSDPVSSAIYRIAVHREPESRGGSAGVHDELRVGHVARISRPRNLFLLDETAAVSILIAGGIGITPIFAMAWRLHALGRNFKLIYKARGRRYAALVDELRASPFVDRIRFAFDDEGGIGAGWPELQEGCPSGKAIYCCGPRGLISQVRGLCASNGIQTSQMHVELFKAEPITGGAPFTVKALRSGVSVEVAADSTILEALSRAGIVAPNSCKSGICGTCLVDVVSGTPDHRDQIQTVAEKFSNRRIALCCSRAKTAELVIDI
jgi:cytochrome P450/ferredoxin-NADP reductase